MDTLSDYRVFAFIRRRTKGIFLPAALWCLLCFPFVLSAVARQNIPTPPPAQNTATSSDESPKEKIDMPAEVVIEGRRVLAVYESVGGLTPTERATGIEERIVAVARENGSSADSIHIQSRSSWAEIFSGDELIMAVTDVDAKMASKPRPQLVMEYAESIRQAIRNYQAEHSWRFILDGIAKTLLVTLLLVPLLVLVRRVRFALRGRIEKQIQASARVAQKSAWHVSIAYLGPISIGVGAFLRWILILAFVEAYLTITLGFFSSTRQISHAVTKWVFLQLESLAQSALNYLPNLLVVVVIALITNYLIRLLRLIFGEIGKENLKIRGFYPDWAEPTEKLIRICVLALAVIVAFPYLPGAGSPAFRGVSIFLGVLLSLGSSSAVANAIAGIILTYMRSFLVGDWVQIGETTGEVTERNLLVTRILTPKAEIITIPNATVMGGFVKNYSIEAKKSGVIFHTTVTIGYDAPWRTVHQLLISAALATKNVLHQPAPFILQSNLNDFYVAYELNTYINIPREMLNIYSDLHQNIQDKFNEAGVEICSPHYSSLRDGNVIAIPEQYVRPGYEPPGFRVVPAANEKNSLAKSNTRPDERT
jgi:small-conductance mechanosensitive channel